MYTNLIEIRIVLVQVSCESSKGGESDAGMDRFSRTVDAAIGRRSIYDARNSIPRRSAVMRGHRSMESGSLSLSLAKGGEEKVECGGLPSFFGLGLKLFVSVKNAAAAISF